MAENAVFRLEPENELRVIAVGDQSESVHLELIDGLAEIFGTEMQKNKVYTIPKSFCIGVFSWQGCSIKVIGRCQKRYIVTETFMILPVILHSSLEQMRINAENDDRRGPVTMVVGPAGSGKSSLCRILLNYAARLGRKPFLIDLDITQNSLTTSKTINILNVEKPADIVDGFDKEAMRAYPYHFGNESQKRALDLYYLKIKELGETLPRRLRKTNKNARTSGIIIDTYGLRLGKGYRAITLASLAFEIDKIVVLGEASLYNRLKRDLPTCVEVIYMPEWRDAERSRPVSVR